MSRVAHIDSLDHDDCLRRLATVTAGRIVACQYALPVVHPIRFVLTSGSVVFSLPPGSPLWKATSDHVVAFQADNTADHSDTTWSVLVVGICREVRTATHIDQLRELPLPRWHTTQANDHIMILATDRISGEAIDWGQRHR